MITNCVLLIFMPNNLLIDFFALYLQYGNLKYWSMSIKFYKSDSNVEIPLNMENWFYVQVQSTIRTAFYKYEIKMPKYVFVEENGENVKITVFRSDLDDWE